MRKEKSRHLPELLLFAGCQRGLVREQGIRMNRQRRMFQNQLDLAGIGLQDLVQCRDRLCTKRTLVVEKLHYLYGSLAVLDIRLLPGGFFRRRSLEGDSLFADWRLGRARGFLAAE